MISAVLETSEACPQTVRLLRKLVIGLQNNKTRLICSRLEEVEAQVTQQRREQLQ